MFCLVLDSASMLNANRRIANSPMITANTVNPISMLSNLQQYQCARDGYFFLLISCWVHLTERVVKRSGVRPYRRCKLNINHQEAACDAASVHFRPSITRTEILICISPVSQILPTMDSFSPSGLPSWT